ncbi:unnamed protein product, partial [Vitis vinifera]
MSFIFGLLESQKLHIFKQPNGAEKSLRLLLRWDDGVGSIVGIVVPSLILATFLNNFIKRIHPLGNLYED